MTEQERPARHRRCCEASDGSRRGRGQGALLEPLVLAVLARTDAHGYDIVREIAEITGGTVVADLGGIYRVLRRLDDAGVVTSAWAEGDVGPARREYRLTDDGRELLAHWMDHLEERRRTLDVLIDAVRGASARA
jgi:DNA-binding PadR family transcriptional regulator